MLLNWEIDLHFLRYRINKIIQTKGISLNLWEDKTEKLTKTKV